MICQSIYWLLVFFFVIAEFVCQSLFDESRYPASGKLSNSNFMAQVVELSPVFLPQFLTRNQLFYFALGIKNSYFMYHVAPPRMNGCNYYES